MSRHSTLVYERREGVLKHTQMRAVLKKFVIIRWRRRWYGANLCERDRQSSCYYTNFPNTALILIQSQPVNIFLGMRTLMFT